MVSDSRRKITVPVLWTIIVVLVVLLGGAFYLLTKPGSDANEGSNTAGDETSEPADSDDDGESEVGDEDDLEPTPETTTGPLRAKLSDAIDDFHVGSWVESEGLIDAGAEEAYEGFYTAVDADLKDDDEETSEPVLIAAGRWDAAEDVEEWLESVDEDNPVIPAELVASGSVPGVDDETVGEYRYFEAPDGTEGGVVWQNRDLGLILIGQPETVETIFTQLPL